MPTLAEMRMALAKQSNPIEMQSIGVNEAPNVFPKVYMPPDNIRAEMPPPGGVATPSGMPIGGIDMSRMNPGQQLTPQPLQQQPQPTQPGQQPSPLPTGFPQGPQGMQGQAGQAPRVPSNILSLTPQGQAMSAMRPPQGMAEGGQPRKTFAIKPATSEPAKEASFTTYDPDKIRIATLAKAFDEAIAHHVSLDPAERVANSMKAAKAVSKYIGTTSNGKTKDLLGKNEKLLKTEKGYGSKPIELPDGRGIETTGLALSPAYEQSGFNTCPNSASCKKECLGKTSGNYFKLGGGQDLSDFKGPRLNSLNKTQAFLHDPHSFAVKLFDEIQSAKDMAAANGNHLGVRLNVLSDIAPRVHKAIIENHPDVTFYDYTKNKTDPIADNHHYTYSSTGVSQPGVENENSNWHNMRRRLDDGHNVAMAFTHKRHLPEMVHDQETGKKYKVINGDTHDFRPFDIQPEGADGVIIGLKNKKATGEMQNAHKDSNGFFVHYDPQEKMEQKGKKSVYARDKNGDTIPQNRVVNIQPQKAKLKVSTNDGEEA